MAIRGSDRNFFRLKWNDKDSAILIQYNPNRIENVYYADIAIFLRSIYIPVPLMISHDPAACLMLMEDMGDANLWSLKDTPWETRQGLYQKTLSIVHRLHLFPESDFPREQVRLMDGFDPELYRWEQNYFREHFVNGICGIDMETPLWHEIEAELSDLARRLVEKGRTLVHRDLQSQNVMIRDGEPFLIDFQGMRFGSPFYDIGSLLCDPYVRFSEDEVDNLLLFYYRLSKQIIDWPDFQNAFWEASAQRLMQALGAYGFLGLKKGLKTFLGYIPVGLMNLQRAASHATSLIRLRELSEICHKRIKQNSILSLQ
ncbi:MAG: phosphotransferase [Proteobacteria bacterium]|nr:phosphotransferase [Pseudomonadota bacterium]